MLLMNFKIKFMAEWYFSADINLCGIVLEREIKIFQNYCDFENKLK